MKLYFDESGQTGCVVPNRNGKLYGKNQRFFILAGMVCQNDEDVINLTNKYGLFLEKYGVASGELKGTDILKPENKGMLADFIENMIDDRHIYICCYDKIFYLASMISTYLLDRKTMKEQPLLYFTQQSALTRENQRIFIKFCEALEEGTSCARREFVRYMVNYPYEKFDIENNMYAMAASVMLMMYGDDEEMPDFPLPKGKGVYLDNNITHLINLNALGETLLALKVIYHIPQSKMEVYHDHIIEFEPEFYDSLRETSLTFVDSKDELLIQYADNVASIYRRIYSETVDIFGTGKQWETDKQYYPKMLSKIMKKVSERNIKFVTAISDWVLPIAVAVQFDDKTPKITYNNKDFMSLFMRIREKVLENIDILDYDVK